MHKLLIHTVFLTTFSSPILASPLVADPGLMTARRLLKYNDAGAVPSNLVVNNGHVYLAEINRIVGFHQLHQVNLVTGQRKSLRTTAGALFVTNLPNGQLFITDPFEDRYQIVNTAKFSIHTGGSTPTLEGAWQTTSIDNVVFGSNRAKNSIIRFDLNRGSLLTSLRVRSGTGDLLAYKGLLYAIEAAMPGYADKIIALNPKTGAIAKEWLSEGKLRRLFAWKGQVCTLDSANWSLQCLDHDQLQTVRYLSAPPLDADFYGKELVVLTRRHPSLSKEGALEFIDRLTETLVQQSASQAPRTISHQTLSLEGLGLDAPYKVAADIQSGTILIRDHQGLLQVKSEKGSRF